MLSKLTLIGLSNYTNGSIWDNLSLPDGVDSTILIDEILRKGGEFPCIYPDIDFLTYMIGHWSSKWYHNFERWVEADTFDYNPLYNLDVESTTTEEGYNASTNSSSLVHGTTVTHSGNTTSSTTSDETTTDSKAAMDASAFQNTQKEVTNGSGSLLGTTSGSDVTTGTDTTSGSDSGNHFITTIEKRAGNQGVTMSQDMLLAEYNVRKWNLYDHISDIFVNEFCICIYS